jgi:hypothetical protein
MLTTGSSQLVEQRLCFFEIGSVEAFGEPAIDRREKVAGRGVAALVAAEPGEARGGAQLEPAGFLLTPVASAVRKQASTSWSVVEGTRPSKSPRSR